MKRMSTLTSERRNDLHLTSTGVSLARRHSAPLELPPLSKPLLSSLPLPSCLSPSSCAPTKDEVYQTTTATTYNHCHEACAPLLYRKAPGHWMVNYTLENIHKLDSKPWRRSLTMSNQMSETRAQYCGQPETISRVIPINDPQPTPLSDHFTDGPTKELIPSGKVKCSAGREQHEALSTAVLDKNHPYLTTNNRFHCSFSREEQLMSYAQKDAATYWQCENYPKTWGHGTKVNPLTTPTCRSKQGPMIDRSVFRTDTSVRRLPSPLKPLSQGNRTVYTDTHTGFDEEQRQQLFYCPVQPTQGFTTQCKDYDESLVQLVPQMYRTGNMTYGPSSHPQTVE